MFIFNCKIIIVKAENMIKYKNAQVIIYHILKRRYNRVLGTSNKEENSHDDRSSIFQIPGGRM